MKEFSGIELDYVQHMEQIMTQSTAKVGETDQNNVIMGELVGRTPETKRMNTLQKRKLNLALSREANQERTRQAINAKRYITRLNNLANTLRRKRSELTQVEIQAITKEADIYFRMLNKVLPDLKHVQMDNEGGDVVFNVGWLNQAPQEN